MLSSMGVWIFIMVTCYNALFSKAEELGIIVVPEKENITNYTNELNTYMSKAYTVPTTKLISVYKFSSEDAVNHVDRRRDQQIPNFTTNNFNLNNKDFLVLDHFGAQNIDLTGFQKYKSSVKINSEEPSQTETITTTSFHKQSDPFDASSFQQSQSQNQEAAEVHYHQHSHFHKHKHQQEHSHNHDNEHKHEHGHTHEHHARNTHQYQSQHQHFHQFEHSHNHKSTEQHRHHDEHKHQHHSMHVHGHKHSGSHQHEANHENHHGHKQDHKHLHEGSHKHDHLHEHKQEDFHHQEHNHDDWHNHNHWDIHGHKIKQKSLAGYRR